MSKILFNIDWSYEVTFLSLLHLFTTFAWGFTYLVNGQYQGILFNV